MFPLGHEEITFQKAEWAAEDTVQSDMNEGLREGGTASARTPMIENERLMLPSSQPVLGENSTIK